MASSYYSLEEYENAIIYFEKLIEENLFDENDFIKIDVEGAELEVLRGIDLSEFNPRILVIEATKPNSSEVAYSHWEDRVLSSGYVCALFDGLNRFYVKENDTEVIDALKAPANVLDDFKSIIHIELEQIASSAQNTVNTYLEQYHNAQQYAESLQTELQKYDLKIADHQQKVIDAEEKNLILKTANSALEKNLIKYTM